MLLEHSCEGCKGALGVECDIGLTWLLDGFVSDSRCWGEKKVLTTIGAEVTYGDIATFEQASPNHVI